MRSRTIFGVKLFGYGCLFFGLPFVFCAESQESLSEAIEVAVLNDPEVAARKEHSDLLAEMGALGGTAVTPELRVKLEQERLSDDSAFETALRWKFDPSNSKWLRKKEYEKEVALAESKVRMAVAKTRARLKRSYLKFTYMNDLLELARSEMRLREDQLKDSEVLLDASSTDRWTHFRVKREHARASDEVERLKKELEVEGSTLSALGLPMLPSSNQEFSNRWSIGEVSSLEDLIAKHPQSSILRAERLFESEQMLAERKEAKGVNLSYVQLQAEQEGGWNRDESDSRLGISFGVELPWKRKKQLNALTVASAENDAQYEEELSRTSIQLADTYEAFCQARERRERMLPMIDELLEELRLLSDSLASESNVSRKIPPVELQKERARLLRERKELHYQLLEAALDLESGSCQELVFY